MGEVVSKVEIELKEATEVFLLFEKLNNYFHNEKNYQTVSEFRAFSKSIYPEIRKAYYDTTWEWLPKEVQEEIEER